MGNKVRDGSDPSIFFKKLKKGEEEKKESKKKKKGLVFWVARERSINMSSRAGSKLPRFFMLTAGSAIPMTHVC